MISHALKGRAISPAVNLVALLNPDKILPVELSLSSGICICLKAVSCNKLAALPGSTSTLCTSKLLMHKVKTSASWCRVITLEGLMGGGGGGGEGYGAVNRLYCFAIIWGTDGFHPGSNCGCSQQLFPLMTELVLVFGWASQYVIDGG